MTICTILFRKEGLAIKVALFTNVEIRSPKFFEHSLLQPDSCTDYSTQVIHARPRSNFITVLRGDPKPTVGVRVGVQKEKKSFQHTFWLTTQDTAEEGERVTESRRL